MFRKNWLIDFFSNWFGMLIMPKATFEKVIQKSSLMRAFIFSLSFAILTHICGDIIIARYVKGMSFSTAFFSGYFSRVYLHVLPPVISYILFLFLTWLIAGAINASLKAQLPWKNSFIVVNYAFTTPLLICAFPFIGPFIYLVWGFILLIIGMRVVVKIA